MMHLLESWLVWLERMTGRLASVVDGAEPRVRGIEERLRDPSPPACPGSVLLRVVDDAGEPAPGVDVVVRAGGSGGAIVVEATSNGRGWVYVPTDPEGDFWAHGEGDCPDGTEGCAGTADFHAGPCGPTPRLVIEPDVPDTPCVATFTATIGGAAVPGASWSIARGTAPFDVIGGGTADGSGRFAWVFAGGFVGPVTVAVGTACAAGSASIDPECGGDYAVAMIYGGVNLNIGVTCCTFGEDDPPATATVAGPGGFSWSGPLERAIPFGWRKTILVPGPGLYTLTGSKAYHVDASQSVTVSGCTEAGVGVTLPRTHVKVVGSASKSLGSCPIDGATVELSTGESGTTGLDGIWTGGMAEIPPGGTIAWTVSHEHFTPISGTIAVSPTGSCGAGVGGSMEIDDAWRLIGPTPNAYQLAPETLTMTIIEEPNVPALVGVEITLHLQRVGGLAGHNHSYAGCADLGGRKVVEATLGLGADWDCAGMPTGLNAGYSIQRPPDYYAGDFDCATPSAPRVGFYTRGVVQESGTSSPVALVAASAPAGTTGRCSVAITE